MSDIDHLVFLLTQDAETLENMFLFEKQNTKDAGLLADHKRDLALIDYLRSVQVEASK